MTYARVIPRDLFNEGDLLNCLGRLWIKLDERRDHTASLTAGGPDGIVHSFPIDQDESDGSISCACVMLTFAGSDPFRLPRLFRPLNAREKWPLWLAHDNEDVRVFDLNGDLTPEFWTLISQPELTRQRSERVE